MDSRYVTQLKNSNTLIRKTTKVSIIKQYQTELTSPVKIAISRKSRTSAPVNESKDQRINPYDEVKKRLRFDAEGRCTNAFIVMTSTSVLKWAYEMIKSKPGNMTRGSDNETIDGISKD